MLQFFPHAQAKVQFNFITLKIFETGYSGELTSLTALRFHSAWLEIFHVYESVSNKMFQTYNLTMTRSTCIAVTKDFREKF